MLVLSFREGRTLMIGDDIGVRVTAIFRDRVCLAIRRPEGIFICSKADHERLISSSVWSESQEISLALAQRMLDPEGGEVPLILAEDIAMMIGPDIEIILTDILYGQGKVRIGTKAPVEVPVHRMKVYEQIKSEQEADAIGAAKANDLPRT